MLGVVVHTTGVNWDGVLANVAAITVILGAFGALLYRAFKQSVREQIDDVVSTHIMPLLTDIRDQLMDHDTRLARLEGMEEGKRQAVAQAIVGPRQQ